MDIDQEGGKADMNEIITSLEGKLNRLYEAFEEPQGDEDGPDTDFRVLESAVADVKKLKKIAE